MCYHCGYGKYDTYCTESRYNDGDQGPFEADSPTTYAYGEEQ